MIILYDMTTITVSPAGLRIELSWAERIGGLARDLEAPLAAVRSATLVEDGLTAARGLRAPGLALPGVRKIGTWRRRGEKTLVSVRRGQPALLVELDGARYDRVLVSHERAQQYVDQLHALGVGAP